MTRPYSIRGRMGTTPDRTGMPSTAEYGACRQRPAGRYDLRMDPLPQETMRDVLPAAITRGYRRFRTGRFAAERARYRELGEGIQRPETMVVACSDSRAAPETILDAGPGELFVVRNVAGLVPAYAPDGRAHAASAALEFGVQALGVSTILVLGHGRCGGIAAALGRAGAGPTDFLGAWVAEIAELVPTIAAAGGEATTTTTAPAGATQLALERAVIDRSVENLRTFPWVDARVASGSLRLSGAWFDIALGELHARGPHGWVRIPDRP
jgi:carbonic anhydrase